MASAKSVVPAPSNSDEKPFEIRDRITVFDAAMIYAGRHPHGRFLKDGSVADYLDFLRAGTPDQARSRERARARQSWDILCQLINRIQNRTIKPARITYQPSGEIDPTRTLIQTSDLTALATERGGHPKYLRHLCSGTAQRSVSQRTPLNEASAKKFAAKFIADEEAAGRRPTLARLEAAAREAKKRGGRDCLRRAFHQIRGTVRRGRPPNISPKFAQK
jgi:hypothetical protein